LIIGTTIAALLTTIATLIIFEERFQEGAWLYFVFIPLLFLVFSFFRKRIGAPSPEMEYLGRIDSNLLAGFGFGQAYATGEDNGNGENGIVAITWIPERVPDARSSNKTVKIERVLTLLDASNYAEQALPVASFVCEMTGGKLTLLSSSRDFTDGEKKEAIKKYLKSTAKKVRSTGIQVNTEIRLAPPVTAARELEVEKGVDLVVVTTRGGSGEKNWKEGGLSRKLVHQLDAPVLLVQVYESGAPIAPHCARILIALDGSVFAEQLLPYARTFGRQFNCELMLVCVPVVPESEKYRAPDRVVRTIRKQTVEKMETYLTLVADSLRSEGLHVRTVVYGSNPARDIVEIGKREGVDLIMITSQGRGGLDLILMGSVAQKVVQLTDSPVFILPINKE
jgi:nucleotide-binding universal stress UspA family protein